MTLVVDASALVARLVRQESAGRWVEAVIADESLAAPAFILSEAANALRSMELRGQLTATEAARAYRDLLALNLDLRPYRPFAERIWELRHNLTSYDAWYVALAEALGCPLVTIDYRLVRSPGTACAFLTPPAGDG